MKRACGYAPIDTREAASRTIAAAGAVLAARRTSGASGMQRGAVPADCFARCPGEFAAGKPPRGGCCLQVAAREPVGGVRASPSAALRPGRLADRRGTAADAVVRPRTTSTCSPSSRQELRRASRRSTAKCEEQVHLVLQARRSSLAEEMKRGAPARAERQGRRQTTLRRAQASKSAVFEQAAAEAAKRARDGGARRRRGDGRRSAHRRVLLAAAGEAARPAAVDKIKIAGDRGRSSRRGGIDRASAEDLRAAEPSASRRPSSGAGRRGCATRPSMRGGAAASARSKAGARRRGRAQPRLEIAGGADAAVSPPPVTSACESSQREAGGRVAEGRPCEQAALAATMPRPTTTPLTALDKAPAADVDEPARRAQRREGSINGTRAARACAKAKLGEWRARGETGRWRGRPTCSGCSSAPRAAAHVDRSSNAMVERQVAWRRRARRLGRRTHRAAPMRRECGPRKGGGDVSGRGGAPLTLTARLESRVGSLGLPDAVA